MKKSGYTLVELLMTFTLMTVLVLIISSSINLTKYFTITNRKESQERTQVKNVMKSLVADLREAVRGYDETCPNPSDPNNFCVLNDGARLTFKVPENISADGIVVLKTIDYTFNATDKLLTRSEISSGGVASTPMVVGRKISNLVFYRDATVPNVIRLGVVSESGKYQDRTQVFLRNSR